MPNNGEEKARQADVERALAEANRQTSNHREPEATSSVRVKPGHVVEHAGGLYTTGMVLDMPNGEAEGEADAGRVEIVGPSERRKY